MPAARHAVGRPPRLRSAETNRPCVTTRLTDAATAPIEFSVVVVVVVMVVAASHTNGDAGRADNRPMVVMVVMMVVAMMVVMAIARDLHLIGLIHDVLPLRRTGRCVGRPQCRHGVRVGSSSSANDFAPLGCADAAAGVACAAVSSVANPAMAPMAPTSFLSMKSLSLWLVLILQRTHLRQAGPSALNENQQTRIMFRPGR